MLSVNQTCKKLLALADNCIHPTTKKPYMKLSVGGRDNSPEGRQVVAYPLSYFPKIILIVDGREDSLMGL